MLKYLLTKIGYLIRLNWMENKSTIFSLAGASMSSDETLDYHFIRNLFKIANTIHSAQVILNFFRKITSSLLSKGDY